MELQSRLKARDTVIVTDDTGETVTGEVEQISDTMLILRSWSHELQMAASNVVRVAVPVHTLRNGALIGAAAGFVGGAMAAFSSRCDVVCFSKPAGVFLIGGIFGSIGMGAGALVGASIHRERVVFARAAPGRIQVMIAPFLSPDGTGLRIALRF